MVLAVALSRGADAAPQDIGVAFRFAPRDAPEATRTGEIRVRGALALDRGVGSTAMPREISGLAWSADDRILYAVTDGGQLLLLRPRLSHGDLVGLSLLAVHPLADTDGVPLGSGATDAEGLAVLDGADGRTGNTRLLISFEGRPLLAEHAPDGRRRRVLTLPGGLADARLYAGGNQGLEALAWHPDHGVVVAPEHPLRGEAGSAVTLHAGDGATWRYFVENVDEQSITGLDTLPDGSLLALERRYSHPWLPVVITISRLRLDDDGLVATPLARFSSAEGWPVDNFEAIAWHRGNRFFIASDDNASPWQRALLVYLEFSEPGARRRSALEQARHQLDQVARPRPVVELGADQHVPTGGAGAR